MPDREKVIKGLESCILRNPDDHARCSQCSYGGNCVNRLKMDALALLKEQEAVAPKKESDGKPGKWATWWHVCGNCGGAIDAGDRFCRYCGRGVKWDAAD